MGADDILPFILSGVGRVIGPFLPEADQVMVFPCLAFGGQGGIVTVMGIIVVRGVIALRPVIQAWQDDFLWFFNGVAAVVPVVYRTVPAHRLLFHDDIHAVRQVGGKVVGFLIVVQVNGQGGVILVRASVCRTVPFHAVNRIQVIYIERF